MEDKVFIKLEDKKTGEISQEVSIRDLIFNQSDIEFEFKDIEIGSTTLPYNDFIFYQEDFEVIVVIK